MIEQAANCFGVIAGYVEVIFHEIGVVGRYFVGAR
jgi:hypothetical protein